MSLDALSEALSGAIVEYRCVKNPEHVHILTIPEAAESVDSTKGIRFGDVTCPLCESERTGWIPPSHIRGIWWETAAKEVAERRAAEAQLFNKSRERVPDGW
jgi:hypothetical protein